MLTGTFLGRWWRPDAPEDWVGGVLTTGFDLVSLDLIGTLHNVAAILTGEPIPVVFGQTSDGREVTLADSAIMEEQIGGGGPTMRLSPAVVLVGGHIEAPTESKWQISSVELEHMTAWASPEGFHRTIELSPERHLLRATLSYDVPATEEHVIRGGTLAVDPSQEIAGDLLHGARIAVTAKAEFSLAEPQTIHSISQSFIRPLVHLVTFATQMPASLLTFRVATDDSPRSWVEVISRRRRPSGGDERRLSRHEALFLLPDLLSLDTAALAHWYEGEAKLGRTLDLLTAVLLSNLLEHRFVNTAYAAEAFHEAQFDRRAMPAAIWQKIVEAAESAAPEPHRAAVRPRLAMLNKPSFRDRIQDLIGRGGDALTGLIPDSEGVPERASQLRNRLVHPHTGSRDDDAIFDATDELLLVLEFHLLLVAGFSNDQAAERLRAASRSYNGLWLRRSRGGREENPSVRDLV
jgi:hypothetical protein